MPPPSAGVCMCWTHQHLYARLSTSQVVVDEWFPAEPSLGQGRRPGAGEQPLMSTPAPRPTNRRRGIPIVSVIAAPSWQRPYASLACRTVPRGAAVRADSPSSSSRQRRTE